MVLERQLKREHQNKVISEPELLRDGIMHMHVRDLMLVLT